MKQRKYSAAEIDQMRRCVREMQWRADPMVVEEQLRTYMLNGTEPSELSEFAEERALQYRAQYQAALERFRQGIMGRKE